MNNVAVTRRHQSLAWHKVALIFPSCNARLKTDVVLENKQACDTNPDDRKYSPKG